MRLLGRALLGAIAGTAPGLVLLGLTLPVSGEAELTLGVAGIFVSLFGAATGMAFAIVTGLRERSRGE